jgi:hypothetical protein
VAVSLPEEEVEVSVAAAEETTSMLIPLVASAEAVYEDQLKRIHSRARGDKAYHCDGLLLSDGDSCLATASLAGRADIGASRGNRQNGDCGSGGGGFKQG